MNIIINAASIFKGGAEQVAHSFISECTRFPEHNFHIFLRKNIGNQLDIEQFPNNFTFHFIKERPGRSLYHVWQAIKEFNRLAVEIKPDSVISTGGHGFWKPDIPVVGGFNIPHYVYPESPYFRNLSLKKKIYWKLKKKFDLFFYNRLDAIVVQTDDVKHRLKKLINEKPLFTVSNTVNATFLRNEFGKSRLPVKSMEEFRMLTISSDYPHKNLGIISHVIQELRKRGLSKVKFVTTLPEDAFQVFREAGVDNQMINVGPVPIQDCPALYRDCDAMFLPTLLECFSASYAEAMKMERPILTSDLGFAHSVCKKAALYFDPINPIDIVNKIEMLLNDKSLSNYLVSEGKKEFKKFSTPADRAKRYLKLCEEMVEKSKS